MDLLPQHLELNCPACGVDIILDHAFAGSICRCSSCGALVSVHPDAAGVSGETKTRHDDPIQNMTAADIHPTVLSEHRAMAGRSVMAYQRDILPRQTGKRLLQITAVLLIMMTISAAAFLLVTEHDLKQVPTDPINRTDHSTMTNGGDLASHAPLFFGIALDSPAVVLIDATVSSAAWLDDAKSEIRKIVDVLKETHTPVTFIFFTGNQIAMPRFESSMPIDDQRLDAITAAGTLLPADAISRLSNTQMSRLVLVSSQDLSDMQVNAIDKVLADTVRLDVIWQGKMPVAINALVEKRQGQAVERVISK